MPNKYLDSDGLAEYTTLVKTALNTKAPLNSPALTGTPTAPTASAGTDTTQIATTEFVQDAIDSEETRADGAYLPLAGGTVTGNLSVSGSITGNVTGNASTATNATNDANGNPIASTYLPLAGGTLTGAVNGVTPTAGDDSTKLATTAYVREEVRQHSGIPIGHIYFSVNPNIPQGSLPLFGGEFSRETYSDLWAWVQQQAGYCKTEAEWQALATNNNNNVPYYSDGDGSTTFRVPSLRCWVKGADGTVVEVGSYLQAGVPNITGDSATNIWTTNNSSGSVGVGAVEMGSPTTSTTMTGTTTNHFSRRLRIDASNSNAIYGKSSTVQPESIVGMWLVKAYGTIEDTGVIDEQQYIDDRIAALPNTFLPLAGGTMIGGIKFDVTGEIGYRGTAHTSPYNPCKQLIVSATDIDHWGDAGGAKISLHTYDSTGTNTLEDGSFSLLATDGTNGNELKGKPDGTLNWSGYSIRLNGYNSNTAFFQLTNLSNVQKSNVDVGWSYDAGTGAGLGLRCASDELGNNAGEFFLFARKGNTGCVLSGKPDGSLTWNNKDVERVNAKGTNYIRYESGLQICWGILGAGTSLTATYPVAFSAEPSIATSSSSNVTIAANVSGRQNTGFVATLSASSYMRYIAIGKWK